jgi:hypothetical protein
MTSGTKKLIGLLAIVSFFSLHENVQTASVKRKKLGSFNDSKAKKGMSSNTDLFSNQVLKEYADQVVPYMNLEMDPCDGT